MSAEEKRRTAQALLNKICPENVATIAKKMAQIEVSTSLELEALIDLIFRKALAEPHYCETYADLIFRLMSEFPEFPGQEEGHGDSSKRVSFRSSVLNICQNEFERTLYPSEEGGEEVASECDARERTRMLANMKFIGHLFLRQLLSTKVIGSIISELVFCESDDEDPPSERNVECACELLMAVGHTLESIQAGRNSLDQTCARLLALKGTKTSEGKSLYSKRVQFQVQDLFEAREAGWAKRTFKDSAKTKEEIRQAQQLDLAAKSKGMDPSVAANVIAGQRPCYMNAAIGA